MSQKWFECDGGDGLNLSPVRGVKPEQLAPLGFASAHLKPTESAERVFFSPAQPEQTAMIKLGRPDLFVRLTTRHRGELFR